VPVSWNSSVIDLIYTDRKTLDTWWEAFIKDVAREEDLSLEDARVLTRTNIAYYGWQQYDKWAKADEQARIKEAMSYPGIDRWYAVATILNLPRVSAPYGEDWLKRIRKARKQYPGTVLQKMVEQKAQEVFEIKKEDELRRMALQLIEQRVREREDRFQEKNSYLDDDELDRVFRPQSKPKTASTMINPKPSRAINLDWDP
jgi:hypothetical protein